MPNNSPNKRPSLVTNDEEESNERPALFGLNSNTSMNAPVAATVPRSQAADSDYWIFNPRNLSPEQVAAISGNVIEIIYQTNNRTVYKCSDEAGNFYTVKKITSTFPERTTIIKSLESYVMIQNENFPFITPLVYASTFNRNNISTMINRINGTNIIITEYIDGKSFEKIPTNSIDYKTAMSILEQLDNILFQISKKGYVHRDIKGENIVLTPENKVYLIDFDTLCNIHDTTGRHSCKVEWWGRANEGGEASLVGTYKYTRAAARKRPYTYSAADDKYALGMFIVEQLRRISKDGKTTFELIGINMRKKWQSGGKKRKTRRNSKNK
jgi:serine/threonine protein kinase